MKKENIQYCVYCGTKNKLEDKKCIKCHKKLNPKDHPLLDYLKSKTKDNLKGKLEDNIFSTIINYIKSHLYGFILTCSIIVSTTCIVTNIINTSNIQNVTEKPATLNKCIFDNYSLAINQCNQGYELEEGICIKTEEIEATPNNFCPTGYSLDNARCISNITYNKLTREECLLPDDGAYEVYVSDTGECVANYCNEWTDGECASGSGNPIDFTITEYCPDGTTIVNGVCKVISNITTEYSCEQGTLNENKCIITFEEEPHIGCEEGYILNEECNLCIPE